MIDFANQNFYSAQNVFVELHCAQSDQLARATERLKALQDLKAWPFQVDRMAYILHDKDKDDKGELKPVHFHILLITQNKTGKKQWIETLSKVLQCDPVQVSLSSVKFENSCLRYMLHRTPDSLDKYQYPIESAWESHRRMFEKALEVKASKDPTWDEFAEMQTLREVYECGDLYGFRARVYAWETIQGEENRKDEKEFLEAQIDGLRQELEDNLQDWKRLQEIFRNYLAENGTLFGPMKEILDIVYARIQKIERN